MRTARGCVPRCAARFKPVLAVAIAILALLGLPPRVAWAAPPDTATSNQQQPALGFSNLVVRLPTEDRIGIAAEDYRVAILEVLRAKGFNAVGAEDLVFDKDRSRDADYLLGGTVRELQCAQISGLQNCRIGIQWQLLDVRSDTVVYTMMARYVEYHFAYVLDRSVGRRLVLGALRRLVLRPQFRAALQHRPKLPAATNLPKSSFRRCPASGLNMPRSSEKVLAATVLVSSGDGFWQRGLPQPAGDRGDGRTCRRFSSTVGAPAQR